MGMFRSVKTAGSCAPAADARRHATDPATYVAVTLTLVAVALLACMVPTVRTLPVDSAATLRDNG